MSGILSAFIGRVAGVVTDAYFNLVTLLLPGNGTNGAQNNTFLDSSSNNFTITSNGNRTQGTFSPFSQTGWSAYLSSVYGSSTFTSRTLFNGNSTIELWVYPNALSGQQTFVRGGGLNFGTNGAKLRIDDGTNAGSVFESTGSIIANTWNHVAVVRSSNTFTFFINGNSDSSNASISSFYTSNATDLNTGAFNSGGSNPFVGYLSNIRVSNTARTISLPTSAYSSDANTVWLIFQSNRFVDNSSNAYALTFVGTPSVQAFSPFLPTAAYSAATVGGSGYFDSSGDYLTGNGSLSTSTSQSTLSVEGWFYPTSFANQIWLIGDMDPTGAANVISVRVTTGGVVEFYWYDGAVKFASSTGVMRLNQWNWFAVVVNSNAISIYVNSTTPGQTGTTALTNRTQTNNLAVGQYSNSNTPAGYIGSLRWSTSARTISSIPTEPYTSDANTRLLLNFTNAGITDATAKNVLETAGNAQISTTQSKFGGSSMYFDGTGDYLKGVYSPNMILSGDFTIECWINFSAHGNYGGIISFANGNTLAAPTSGWALVFYQTTDRLYFEAGGGVGIQATNAVTANQWNHVAVVRSGSTITHYLNGTANGTGTSSATFTPLTTDNFVIGSNRGFDSSMTGYLDDIRISRYARYTSNFTPPTTAFPLQ